MIGALLFAILPTGEPARDRCDLVEVNHFYDGCGKPVFDQVIFWTFDGQRHQVVAWRLLKTESQLPERDWRRGDWVSRWHDGEIFREVRAAGFRESWTQYDPEVLERDILPKERRRDLQRVDTEGKRP